MNTFTGNDYETGGVPASTYNPTHLDVRQWLQVAHEVGARYAVLTAKHMSGFCLWDAKDYDYDVAASDLKTTPGAVAMAVQRLRQRYREFVRAEVARTVVDISEIEAEMRHLFAVLTE